MNRAEPIGVFRRIRDAASWATAVVLEDLVGRLKLQPGVKPVTRIKDGTRRKGLVGRKLIDTRHP
jgi:hypothetical protein